MGLACDSSAMQNTIDTTYTVSFNGKLREGFSRVKVAVALREKLKFNDQQLNRFFKGSVKLKVNADKESAIKLRKLFFDVGVELSIQANGLNQGNTHSGSAPAQNKPNQVTARTSDKFNTAMLQKIFSTPVKKVNISKAYQYALISVGVLTILVPLLYLSLIIGTLFGLFWYLNNIYPYLGNIRGLSLILAYLIPTFVGAVFILFLIKPLFVSYRHAPVRILDERKHKQFFNLVYLLCDNIGVPRPVKIIVDNEINASASLHRGLLGMLKRELVLTVGMPLIAGMNARQLVGVLAHEFGHFSQTTGMRIYYLINTVNYWLYSRAYEPDVWDQRLAHWQSKVDMGALNITLFTAQLCIRATRVLMKGLYHVSSYLSRHMSRQMEFDADRYESRITGSSNFKGTALCLYKLVHARKIVDEMNANAWNENMLFNNLPKAIADQMKLFDDKTSKALESRLSEIQTNAWSSHPADHERIDNVIIQQDPGIFLHEDSASLLMPDFDNLCLFVTAKEYAAAGIEKPGQFMVPDTKIGSMFGDSKLANTSLETYFNGIFSGERFLNMHARLLEKDKDLSLQSIIDKLRHQLPVYREASRNYSEFEKKLKIMKLGYEYVRANIKIVTSEFHISQADLNTINTEINRLEESFVKNIETLNIMDSLFTRRLTLATEHMQGELLDRSTMAVETLHELRKFNTDITELKRLTFILSALTSEKDSGNIKKLQLHVDKNTKGCQDLANQLLYRLREVKYFDNEKQSKRNMEDFVKSWFRVDFRNFSALNAAHCVHYSDSMIHAIRYQYTRIIGELISHCIDVEKKLNIKPLRLLN